MAVVRVFCDEVIDEAFAEEALRVFDVDKPARKVEITLLANVSTWTGLGSA